MSDDEPAEEAPRPARKAKKKRRDAPAQDEAPAQEAAEQAAPRVERPAFAADFPSDPALDDLVQAFEQGNYARVRREAPTLAKRTDRPAVRRAARVLRRRLDPDPIAIYLLIAAGLLLVFLASWYWSHPLEAPR
jgi:hypothetical protein